VGNVLVHGSGRLVYVPEVKIFDVEFDDRKDTWDPCTVKRAKEVKDHLGSLWVTAVAHGVRMAAGSTCVSVAIVIFAHGCLQPATYLRPTYHLPTTYLPTTTTYHQAGHELTTCSLLSPVNISEAATPFGERSQAKPELCRD